MYLQCDTHSFVFAEYISKWGKKDEEQIYEPQSGSHLSKWWILACILFWI